MIQRATATHAMAIASQEQLSGVSDIIALNLHEHLTLG
jgi:hypothetical protein